MSKYHARRTTVDGHTFASQAEATRYLELRLLEQQGHISRLELQPRYPFVVNGHPCGSYVADFRYVTSDGLTVVEDVKSEPTKTPLYRLKRKLMIACHEITITEVSTGRTRRR